MPRSLPRRVQLLESRPRGSIRPRDRIRMVLTELERVAAMPGDGDALTAFRAAWERYRDARSSDVPADAEPPAGYAPNLPASVRVWQWRCFDHPALATVTNRLLTAYLELCRAG